MRCKTLLPALLALVTAIACTQSQPARVAGWKVDPNYTPPTHAYLLLHGPADQIAEVIQRSRAFGWTAVEHATLPSGSAFALMAGPTEIEPNERMWDLIMPTGIIIGPGLNPEARHTTR